jgi:hypothetical protein
MFDLKFNTTTVVKEYPDALVIDEALPLYFSKYHFADGDYNASFFKIKISPIFIPLQT